MGVALGVLQADESDLDRVAPIGRFEHLEPIPLEQQLDQHSCDRIVVDDQNPRTIARHAGRAVVVAQHAVDFFDRQTGFDVDRALGVVVLHRSAAID